METKKLKREFDGRGLNDLAQTNLEEASSIQTELESLSKQMSDKILAVVEEFSSFKKPLYNKRHAVLRSVPHFWAISFMNHPKLKLLITNTVEDCFNYLQFMQIVETDIKSGYQIHFGFDTNPYFYNNKLIKHYEFEDGIYSTRKTTIDWKENMNLCNIERKTSGRKRGPPLENFFDWLLRSSSNDVICDIIKDDLWPDPLKYFFMLDDLNDENSESDTDDDDDCEDFFDYKEEESDDEENLHSDTSTKNS